MANPVFTNQLKALVAKYITYKQDYNVKIYFDSSDHALCIHLTYVDDSRTGYITFIPNNHAYTSNFQLIHDISVGNKNPRRQSFDFSYGNRVTWISERNCFAITNGTSSHDLPQFLSKVIYNIAILANGYLDISRDGKNSDEDKLNLLQSYLVNGKFK